MEELGQRIRQARLNCEITIEEVQKSTKIKRKYLQAIEEGNFEVISQEVFLKGFLRVYANYVGLDGQEILTDYKRLKKLNQKDKETETKTVEIEQGQSTVEKILCFISKHFKKIVAVVVILAVTLSAGFIFYKNGIVDSLEQTVANQKDNTLQESVTTEENINKNQPETTSSKKQIKIKKKDEGDKEAVKTNITIKVIESSWVKVVIDGKVVLENMLNSGTEQSWSADQNVKLLVANAAGVKVLFNGKTFGPFGKQGEVIERQFAIKN